MKVKNEVVTEFLTKVKCNTEFSDEDLILNFTESALKVNSINLTKTVVISGELKSSAFIEYETIGKIGVQKLGEIVSILRTFGEEVELKVTGNILMIKEKGRKVEFELLDTSMILEAPEQKKEMVFNENIVLPSKDINGFLADASMNKEFHSFINTEKGKVIFKNDGKYKFTRELETLDSIGGQKLKLGESFPNVMKSFTGNVTFCIGEGMPLRILEKTDNSNLKIIVAPMNLE